MEDILAILNEVRPDIDFPSAERLIDDNILDSFDIITIVGEFNEEPALLHCFELGEYLSFAIFDFLEEVQMGRIVK